MGSLSKSSFSSLSKSDEACSGSVKFIWQHNGLVTCKHWFLFCMGDQVSIQVGIKLSINKYQINEICIFKLNFSESWQISKPNFYRIEFCFYIL